MFTCIVLDEEGQLSGDADDGFGKYRGDDGTEYEGQWQNEEKHGRGTQIDGDGAMYEGEWSHGDRHGKGTQAFATGIKYEGEWSRGDRHGTGTVILPDGAVYEGSFLNDDPCGTGTYTFGTDKTSVAAMEWEWVQPGDKYEGHFDSPDGYMHGTGKFTFIKTGKSERIKVDEQSRTTIRWPDRT